VCDVGGAAIAGIPDAQYILMPYNGWESRPHYCGAICSNDVAKTKRFVTAANMDNFKSPTRYCPKDSSQSWMNWRA
ncbi:MAG: hypothetical protein M1838_004199, partial [Thelocarpon superellum]